MTNIYPRICPVCQKPFNPSDSRTETCSYSCGGKLGASRYTPEQKEMYRQNGINSIEKRRINGTLGRSKGSKNKNPYPMTEAVWARIDNRPKFFYPIKGAHMKGMFKPINIHKYKGDPTKIIYRSSYELKMMSWLDTHSSVEWWQSEEFHIPYFDPSRNKAGHYYPDFLVKFKDGKTILIEVKPFKEIQPPIKGKDTRSEKRYLRECLTFAKNQAKWKHAHKYAEDRGWQFMIMTEKELGLDKINRHH